jgi:hypothetical protein
MLTKRDRLAAYKQIETLQKLRRQNVRLLIERAGSNAELARMAGMQVALLTNIAGPNPIRSIGEYLARKIELSLGLPMGWLDREQK